MILLTIVALSICLEVNRNRKKYRNEKKVRKRLQRKFNCTVNHQDDTTIVPGNNALPTILLCNNFAELTFIHNFLSNTQYCLSLESSILICGKEEFFFILPR